MSFKSLLRDFGQAIVPKRIRINLSSYLMKAGVGLDPYLFFATAALLCMAASVVVYISVFHGMFMEQFMSFSQWLRLVLIMVTSFVSVVILSILILITIALCVYFFVDLRIYNRTKRMEDVLPDFLSAVSSHLKAGMSFEKSLWASIKPEFGALSKEIMICAKKVMTGGSVDSALYEFSHKYDSPMLKRSIDLLTAELKTGGRIAEIIDDVVGNLKKTKQLKDEMSASVITYMIFISSIVVIISPVLFALSYTLIEVIQSVVETIAGSAVQGTQVATLAIASKGRVISSDLFITFSQWALGTIAVFASAIVAIIEKGEVRSGVKYFPIFLFGSQAIYYLALKVFIFIFQDIIQFT